MDVDPAYEFNAPTEYTDLNCLEHPGDEFFDATNDGQFVSEPEFAAENQTISDVFETPRADTSLGGYLAFSETPAPVVFDNSSTPMQPQPSAITETSAASPVSQQTSESSQATPRADQETVFQSNTEELTQQVTDSIEKLEPVVMYSTAEPSALASEAETTEAVASSVEAHFVEQAEATSAMESSEAIEPVETTEVAEVVGAGEVAETVQDAAVTPCMDVIEVAQAVEAPAMEPTVMETAVAEAEPEMVIEAPTAQVVEPVAEVVVEPIAEPVAEPVAAVEVVAEPAMEASDALVQPSTPVVQAPAKKQRFFANLRAAWDSFEVRDAISGTKQKASAPEKTADDFADSLGKRAKKAKKTTKPTVQPIAFSTVADSEQPATESDSADFSFTEADQAQLKSKLVKICQALKDGKMKKKPVVQKQDNGKLRVAPVAAKQAVKPKNRVQKVIAAAKDKFVAMAEMIQKFEVKTPSRFHSKPADQDVFQPTQQMATLKPTIPITPQFATESRLRHHHCETAHEEEPKFEFKATELNRKIFESQGDLGVPRVEKRPVTEPVEFQFRTDKFHPRKEAQEEQVQVPVFKAQPVPTRIFEGPVGVPEKQSIPLTIPASPAITKPVKVEAPEEKIEFTFKAQPMPDLSVPFQPSHAPANIEVKPFERMEKYPDPQKVKEKLFHEEMRKLEALREFKAQPFPSVIVNVPEVEAKAPTVPEPFELKSEILHEKFQEKWNEKLQEEEKKFKEAAEFHATAPMAAIPFVPEKSRQPLTEVASFNLRSETRGQQRQAFDQAQKEKEAAKMEQAKLAEAIKAQEEAAEVARLRKQAVVKAQPIKHYAPVEIKPSSKPLTQPKTPTVAKRKSAMRS